MADEVAFTLSGGSEEHPVPQPPYPDLTLDSTLKDMLAVGMDRSSALDDGLAVVKFGDPYNVTVTWPNATPQTKAQSQIIIGLRAKPRGGARIGIWQSEPKEE